MNRLLALVVAVALVGSSVGSAAGKALAETETAYAVGGTKVPGIPWYEYTVRAGLGYFPDAPRVVVDYPAGIFWGALPAQLGFPDLATATVGESVENATASLDSAVRSSEDKALAIGLSQGAMALDVEQARLANDPSAPSPDRLAFAMFGDPGGTHAFGKSFLAGMFAPGSTVPLLDYTMPEQVDSQYDTTAVVGAYDGLSDFPDRPENVLAVANALIGAFFVHTPAGFTSPSDVPARNVSSITNSRGATMTTYLVPNKHLPLTLPLRIIGMPDHTVDQFDAALQPLIDEGYSRNDNAAAAPVSVDPLAGMDALASLDQMDGLDPQTRMNVDAFFQETKSLLAGLG